MQRCDVYVSFGRYEKNCLRHIELPVVRKDIDVNEHERLSNFALRQALVIKEQRSYCCSTCHSKVFNNVHSIYFLHFLL